MILLSLLLIAPLRIEFIKKLQVNIPKNEPIIQLIIKLYSSVDNIQLIINETKLEIKNTVSIIYYYNHVFLILF